VTTLLKEAAVGWVQFFQARKRLQGVGKAFQVALRYGEHVENVPILRHLREQRFRRCKG